jgi:hypothetical protein
MSGSFPANEVQKNLYDSLSAASDANTTDARSKSLAEADKLLRTNTLSLDDTKAVSEKLSCEGKLGKLIIGEFGTTGLGADQTLSKEQLSAKEAGSAGETLPQRLMASEVLKNFDEIDGTASGAKDKQLSGAEIEAWVNSGATKLCAPAAQPEAVPPAAVAPTPESTRGKSEVFLPPSAPPAPGSPTESTQPPPVKAEAPVTPTPAAEKPLPSAAESPLPPDVAAVPSPSQAGIPTKVNPASKALPATPDQPNGTVDPFDSNFSTVPQKQQGFDKHFEELKKSPQSPDAAAAAPDTAKLPQGFDKHFQELKKSPTAPDAVTPPDTAQIPQGFDKHFQELKKSPTAPDAVTPPDTAQIPQGFDKHFQELKKSPTAPDAVAPPDTAQIPQGFDKHFQELKKSPTAPDAVTPPDTAQIPQGFDKRFQELKKSPTAPDAVAPPDPTQKPRGFEERFNELKRAGEPGPSTAQSKLPPDGQIPPRAPGDKPDGSQEKNEQPKNEQEHDHSSKEARSEKWGSRTFELQSDGTARYQVRSGDNVWSVAADVAEKRLTRKPSNAEILELTKAISEASGLNKNGRNPDLIYWEGAKRDTLTIPAEKPSTESTEKRNESAKTAPESALPANPESTTKPKLPPTETQEQAAPTAETGIDKQAAVAAVKGLTTDSSALMKKAIEIQAQSDPNVEQTKLALGALNALIENSGALAQQIGQTYPEARQKGVTAQQLQQFAADSRNGINGAQREAVNYIADNFSMYSPDDQYLNSQDLQNFAAKSLGLRRESVNKMVADDKNSLTPEERKTLSYFDSNFKTVSADDDILTMPDLKAFVDNYELAKEAQTQPHVKK